MTEELLLESDEPVEVISKSIGYNSFDRIGRPVCVFDQRSNSNESIILNWSKHLEIWKKTQVFA
jgi:hypothetical protein